FAVLRAVVRDAVDDDELGRAVDREQRVVPRAARVVDALPRRRDEGANIVGPRLAPAPRDDDEPARRIERNERLAAADVPLETLQPKRERSRLRADEADADVAAACSRVDARQVVQAPRRAVVDGVAAAAIATLDDIAVAGERLGRERLGDERARRAG